MDQEQRELDDPEQEVAAHALRGDARRLREAVGNVGVRRRDGGEHDGEALGAVGALNTQPEHGQDGTADDAEVTKVESKGPGGEDGEGDMQLGTDGTVQDHGYGDAESTDNHDGESFPPREADGENAGSRLPGTEINRVRRLGGSLFSDIHTVAGGAHRRED